MPYDPAIPCLESSLKEMLACIHMVKNIFELMSLVEEWLTCGVVMRGYPRQAVKRNRLDLDIC